MACRFIVFSYFPDVLRPTNRETKTTHSTFRDCRVHFLPTTFQEEAVAQRSRGFTFLTDMRVQQSRHKKPATDETGSFARESRNVILSQVLGLVVR